MCKQRRMYGSKACYDEKPKTQVGKNSQLNVEGLVKKIEKKGSDEASKDDAITGEKGEGKKVAHLKNKKGQIR